MAQQRYQGDDGTIYEALPGGGYAIVTPDVQTGPYTIGTPDPASQYEAPKAAVDLGNARLTGQRTQQQMALDAMTAPAQAAKAMADARAAQAVAIQKEQELSGRPTTEQRSKLKSDLSALTNLATGIGDLRRLYAQGPGSTTGVAGLGDYLPYTVNQQFDKAGERLAAFVATALGLSGQQFNTPAEQQLFIGSYLPKASDRDEVIQDKIGKLSELLQNARGNAQQQLGIASQDPIQQQQLAAPAIGTQQPQQQAATPGARGPNYFDGGTGPGGPTLNGGGGTQTVADPTKAGVAARLNELLKSGAPDAQVQQYAASVGADPASLSAVLAFRKQNPGYRGNYNASDLELKDEQLGGFRGLANSAAQSPIGAYAINAADALTASNLDSLTANPALARAGLRGVQQANPYSSLAGTVTGSGLAAAGAELGLARAGLGAGAAALVGDGLYGAAYGAGASDDGSRLLGAAVGGVGGLGGGIAGRAGARGVGNALTGIRNADVQGLRAAGVPLTAGQATGGVLKGVEDRLSGLPVIGDMVNARRREGFEGFNRAAFGEGLAPINANTGGVIAEQGIDAARAARSQAYRDALDPVQVQADAPFVADMQGVLRAGEALPDPMRANAGYTLNTRVGNSFSDGSPIQRVGENDGWNQYVYQSSKGDIPFEVWPPSRGRKGIEIAIDENNASGANRLGLRELREAASHLRAEYPNAEYVYGTRTSGAGPGRIQNIDLSSIPVAEAASGSLTGNGFQQSIRGLRRDARAMGNLPYGHDFGDVTRQAEGALEGLLQRQSPGTLPAYNAANTANRNVEVLRDAVNRARNGSRSGETGVFTPSQLADAAAANARRFGNGQGTTNQPFFDLSRAGQRVLPNSVPDSGTAGRAVVAGGLGLAGLGGGAGYAAGDTTTGAGAGLGLAALLAAGGTRTGQRALTAALLDRPDVLIRAGEGVRRNARLGGIFGAPMLAGTGVGLLPQ